MTGIARILLARKYTRQKAIVTALFIAALLSSAFHLPELLRFHEFSGQLVGLVFSHHFASGLVFGWLYWRRGIEAAMICHGLADLIVRLSLATV
jgi:membrane protease YdiL (CAAX protease family)